MDKLLSVAISYAESGFANVCNLTYGCIAGIGPFQIVASTFRAFKCKGTPKDFVSNLSCGPKILAEGGYGHWEPSMHIYRKDGTDAGWLPLYTEMVLAYSRQRLALLGFEE